MIIHSSFAAAACEEERKPLASSFSLSLDRDFSTSMAAACHMTCVDVMADDNRAGLALQHLDCQVANFDRISLSAGAQAMMNAPNAGGNSEKSEALSFEVMKRCFGAQLIKTEMDIEYAWCISKKTDYSCTMFKRRFGVSVTRAYKPKFKGDYTLEDAQCLLKKKLFGVLSSSKDVLEHDAWCKQLLHVWAPSDQVAELIAQAHQDMDQDLVANTLVLVTVVSNAQWVFTGY